MMMPANYSVIAENEMTYVNGGALIDCFAPIMNDGNWKTFNTNLIKIIGNFSMTKFLSSTVGVLFGGDFSFGNWGDTLESHTGRATSGQRLGTPLLTLGWRSGFHLHPGHRRC